MRSAPWGPRHALLKMEEKPGLELAASSPVGILARGDSLANCIRFTECTARGERHLEKQSRPHLQV